MELVKNKLDCCGCAVCLNICPKKAIKMVEDEHGYLYPKIDKDKCIECGLCKKTCAYQMKDKHMQQPLKTFAASCRNEDIIKKSASGGIFTNIANTVLEDEGTVFGASLEKEKEDFKIKHIRVDKKEDLVKLQGSKYVQSDTSKIYSLIKNDLENGKKVLFSGTPCQVNALKGYLKFKEYDNLFTIDIICHGVPNNKMFNDYIKILENKEKGKVIAFKFRDKTKGWGLNAAFEMKKGGKLYKKILPAFKSSYYQLFLDSMTYRENCYNCPYAGNLRVGDITIGDYWKFESEHPEYLKSINPKRGISCIIVNTLKGKKMVSNFLKDILIFESEFDKVQKHNEQLVHPSKIKIDRNEILKLYIEQGYKGVDRYYYKKNSIKILLKKIWYNVPENIRKKLK